MLKKLYFVYICPKYTVLVASLVFLLEKVINFIKSVRRKYTKIVFNCCYVSYKSYLDRLKVTDY